MKHAYMIIAHGNLNILKYHIKLLDDSRNDIYIHIDKKMGYFDEASLVRDIRYANVHFIKRMSVNWGGYSLIKCEIALLRAALETYHDYYHLLSGVDFPIKSQDYINNFFETWKGYEFIDFEEVIDYEAAYGERLKYYHFFQEYLRKFYNNKRFLIFNSRMLKIQKLLGVDRLKHKKFDLYKGSNWFSITHECAVLICGKYKKYQKYFKYTSAADEIFLHTILKNEKNNFKIFEADENTLHANLRHIDWNRGRPYIWRIKDLSELMSSQDLWARKFEEKIDWEIIEKLNERILWKEKL